MKKLVSALVITLILGLTILSSRGMGASIEGTDFADKIDVGSKKLILNGVGLRTATFLAVKVYVAGLYLEKNSADADEILKSKQTKKVEMVFKRKLEANVLQKAWSESFEKNCKVNCDELKPKIKTLNALMTDVAPEDHLSFTFSPENLTVNVKGKEVGKIDSGPFADIILASFIGAHPPTSDLKDGLLKLKK